MNARVESMMESKFRTKLLSISKPEKINWDGFFKKAVNKIGVPLMAIGIFLAIWGGVASQIQTSLGQVPGPTQVWQQIIALYEEHKEERSKEVAFYERQEKRNAAKLVKNPDATTKIRSYTGKATFFDQILTSIVTVMTGFIIASLIAIPVGIVSGLSPTVYNALNPLIQTFKPVSPLAWLPIVTIIVSAVYVSDDPTFSKSFVNSAITVTLCSLWPTIINTTVGVSSMDKDLLNVSRVLRLSWFTHITKIVFTFISTDDVRGFTCFIWYRLDGTHCRRNVGAKSWAWKICLG